MPFKACIHDRRKLILIMAIKFEYIWDPGLTAQNSRSCSYVFINSFNFGIYVA